MRAIERAYRAAFYALAIVLAARGRAVPITEVADSGVVGFSNFSTPAVNSAGTVAFGGNGSLFTGTVLGGPVLTAVNPAAAGLVGVTGSPAINEAGQVGFLAVGPSELGSGTNAYRRDPDGTVTKLYDSVGSSFFTTTTITAGPPANTFYFTIQNNQLPRAGASYNAGGAAIVLLAPNSMEHSVDRIAASPNGNWAAGVAPQFAGGFTALLLNGATALNNTSMYVDMDTPFPFTSNLTQYTDADVSSDGTIVFTANFTSQYNGIWRYHNGTITRLAKGTLGTAAINDNGVIAALLTTGTPTIKYGQGALTDTLISVGDPLAGSTVTGLSFTHDGLSENGYLVFSATLSNGNQGIFAASVPEPTTVGVVMGLAVIAVVTPRRHRARDRLTATGNVS